MENSLKSISTINPAITENTECSIVKCASFINLKVGVSLNHDHAVLYFASSFSSMLGNIPSEE